jgi:diguanylate cyclase (GGDEF)-like protein/PAS domain S-box-containing protein
MSATSVLIYGHHDRPHPVQTAVGWLLLVAALPLFWATEQTAMVFVAHQKLAAVAHSALELVSLVTALLIFVTGYSAALSPRKGAVVLLGIAFLGVGLFDFLNAVDFVWMPAEQALGDGSEGRLFGMGARLLACGALAVYVALPVVSDVSLARKRSAVLLVLVIVATLAYFGGFSDVSQRPELDVYFSIAIIGGNLLTLGLLWLRRLSLRDECVPALAFAAALSMIVEGMLIRAGTAAGNHFDLIEDVYHVASYLYLFHATVNEALRRPLDRMQTQNLKEKVILQAAPDGVLWVNQAGKILMANPAMEVLAGYRSDEMVGQNVSIFLPERIRESHADSMRDFFTRPTARAMGTSELKLLRKDGKVMAIDISLGYWEDENERHAIAYVRDLTERKTLEESMRHRATHDTLTGLPNRWLFNIRLDQALSASRRRGSRVAALFLDLDDFKTVNDSFGHAAGDDLLTQVSTRLAQTLRESDTLARLGGDEFAILLTDVDVADEATVVAEKLLRALDSPYTIGVNEVVISGSIGIAFFPDDAMGSQDLLRFADMAMYQAKNAGRDGVARYCTDLNRHQHENMQMHMRLKDAIHGHGLTLLYQPQVDVRTGAVVGAEALLRWHDEVLGDVPPDRFIPIAESTGLILPLSEWVMQTACQQIAQWQAQGHFIRVSINVSAQQFRQGDLADRLAALLERTGASARLLEIEITETIAMTNPMKAREQLDALVKLGCSIALDDFGTGYSSLAYLKALPVSVLKIDRSFIKDIPDDLNDVQISRSIIALAHSLGLRVVAEGVETQEQRQFLVQFGCETYQGWLYSRAVAPAALLACFMQRP